MGLHMSNRETNVLVVTGGPCGGKTTALNYIGRKLDDYGVSPIFIPEVATILINAGLRPQELTKEKLFSFQELVLKTQLSFEDSIFKEAMRIKGGTRKVIICDRGCMDASAYMAKEEFQKLLSKNKWDEADLCDRRYDGIFHLVTAAEGKEKYYNLDNPARHETPEQARAVDERTRQAWVGHPHLVVIDNSTLFEKKMKRLLNAIRKTLGIPVAVETERKFLVKSSFSLSSIPVPFKVIDIEQFYLQSEDGRGMRLRRRSRENSGSVYYKTFKLPTKSFMSRIEIEEQISELDYYRGLANLDYHFDPIRKQRICFLWKNQYFELDIFSSPERHKGLVLLEIELTEENDRVDIPEWLGRVIEVTGDTKYDNFSLAKRH